MTSQCDMTVVDQCALSVEIDGLRRDLSESDMLDENYLISLLESSKAAATPPVFFLHDLFNVSVTLRGRAIDLLELLDEGSVSYLIEMGDSGRRFDDLHAATMDSIPEERRQAINRACRGRVGCGDGRTPIQRVLGALRGVVEGGGGFTAFCPAHDDINSRSLSIHEADDGRVLLCCHAGCETGLIVSRLGLRWRDLFGSSSGTSTGHEMHVTPPIDSSLAPLANAFRQAMSAGQLTELSRLLRLSTNVLSRFGVGWNEFHFPYKTWTIPEHDAAGNVIGVMCRSSDGTKTVMRGSHRGVYLPTGWQDLSGDIVIPEGFSDTAALVADGVAAVGRPSARGGVDQLAQLLGGVQRDIVILGDNDQRDDGSWPGRDGARACAEELGSRLGRDVEWTLPPEGFKDIRHFITGVV